MVVTPIFACFVANLKSDLFMINLFFLNSSQYSGAFASPVLL